MTYPSPSQYKNWFDWASRLVGILNTPELEVAPKIPVHSINNLPRAAEAGLVILVYDNPDFAPAWSDGTDWRYFIDNEVVS